MFPRWVGYFNLWLALLVIPGLLVYSFDTGVAAASWHEGKDLGVVDEPVDHRVLVFGTWWIVMFIAPHTAIRGETEASKTAHLAATQPGEAMGRR